MIPPRDGPPSSRNVTTTALSICGQCGARLPAGTPSGLCPLCLLDGVDEDDSSLVQEGGQVPGERMLGHLVLYEEIGRGGMGVVWRGRQMALNREVAVKTLPGGEFASAEVRERFRTEALAAARLHHPGIVAVHEVGEEDGMPYLVMELVRGRPLSAVLADGLPPFRRGIEWVRDAALAVQHAHEQRVLHRDLKPSNLLIDAAGRVRLTDFGLAKLNDGDASMTRSRLAAGSPAFMPPEQATSGHAVPESDVYGLGAVLYSVMTGRAPFQGESLATVLTQVQHDEPIPPRRLNVSIPADLNTICLKCLEKRPERRYHSAAGLADDLNRWLEGKPVQARPLSRLVRLWRWAQRHPWRAVALFLALFFVAGMMAGLAWITRNEQKHSAELRLEKDAAQLALLHSRLAEARLLTSLHEADSRPRALALINDVRQHRLAAEIESESRDASIAALAVPEARFTPIPGMSNPVEDWTMIASSLGANGWALADFHGQVTLRDLEGQTLRQTSTAPHKITALMALSAKGRWLSARHREEIGVWDTTATNGASPAVLSRIWSGGRAFGFMHAAFFPNEKAVVIAEPDSVVFYALPEGKELARWQEAEQKPMKANAVAVDPTGQFIAMALHERVEIRHWPSGQIAYSLPFLQTLTAIALTKNANTIAGGGRDGSSYLWQPSLFGEEVMAELRAHSEALRGLVFSDDGAWLASTSDEGTLRLWDVAAASEAAVLRCDIGLPSLSPDGKTIGIACATGQLATVTLNASQVFYRLTLGRPPEIQQIHFMPGTHEIASLTARGAVLRHVPDGRVLADVAFPIPLAVLAPPAGGLMLGSSAGLKYWPLRGDLNTPETAREGQLLFPAARYGWDGFSRSADGRWLAASDNAAARFAVWRADEADMASAVAKAKFIKSGESGAGQIALSPDGSQAVVGRRYDADLILYNTSSGEIIRELEVPARHGLAWSPDGLWVAACGSSVAVWETQTWQKLPLPTIAPNQPPAGDAVFAPLDQSGHCPWLAVISGSEHIALLALPSLQRLATLEAPGDRPLFKLSVSDDGRWLAAGAGRGEVHLWDLPELRRTVGW